MVKSAIKWTPNDNPTTKLINNSHLFPFGSCISCSQRKPNHNSKAINNMAMAYTSASTALNQKLSEKVKVNAPTKELPKIAMLLSLLISV